MRKVREVRHAWVRPLSAVPSPTSRPPADTPMTNMQIKMEENRKRREMYLEAGKYMKQRMSEKMKLRTNRPHFEVENTLLCWSGGLDAWQARINSNSVDQLKVIHSNQKEEVDRITKTLKLSFPQTKQSLRRLSVVTCPSERQKPKRNSARTPSPTTKQLMSMLKGPTATFSVQQFSAAATKPEPQNANKPPGFMAGLAKYRANSSMLSSSMPSIDMF